MAYKWVNDTVLDNLGVDGIKDNATEMVITSDDLSATPTYAEVTSTYDLADVVIDASDMTVANGTTSGRKVTIAEQASISIDTTGSAAQVCLVGTASSPDLSADTVLYVTTCDVQALVASNQVTIPEWVIEIRDPT